MSSLGGLVEFGRYVNRRRHEVIEEIQRYNATGTTTNLIYKPQVSYFIERHRLPREMSNEVWTFPLEATDSITYPCARFQNAIKTQCRTTA